MSVWLAKGLCTKEVHPKGGVVFLSLALMIGLNIFLFIFIIQGICFHCELTECESEGGEPKPLFYAV